MTSTGWTEGHCVVSLRPPCGSASPSQRSDRPARCAFSAGAGSNPCTTSTQLQKRSGHDRTFRGHSSAGLRSTGWESRSRRSTREQSSRSLQSLPRHSRSQRSDMRHQLSSTILVGGLQAVCRLSRWGTVAAVLRPLPVAEGGPVAAVWPWLMCCGTSLCPQRDSSDAHREIEERARQSPVSGEPAAPRVHRCRYGRRRSAEFGYGLPTREGDPPVESPSIESCVGSTTASLRLRTPHMPIQ